MQIGQGPDTSTGLYLSSKENRLPRRTKTLAIVVAYTLCSILGHLSTHYPLMLTKRNVLLLLTANMHTEMFDEFRQPVFEI